VAPEPPSGALLSARGVSKRFGAVQALLNVDLDLYAGEVLALVGDNGAGKSTLIRAIAGNYPVDSGQFYFDDEPVRIHGPRDAARLGIEIVYQDLALCDNLTVTQNMFLGREEVSGARLLSEASMQRRATETMRSLAVTTLTSVNQNVARLSGGQRQSVAVAKAVMWNSRAVILDEPTAALGVAQTRQVLDLVRRLAERGLGVIVISHNLHDLFEIADRFLVLRLGQSVGTYERASTTQQEIVQAITAGKLEHVPGMEGGGDLNGLGGAVTVDAVGATVGVPSPETDGRLG
jgi:D-xylose transport system ATP-binding protein